MNRRSFLRSFRGSAVAGIVSSYINTSFAGEVGIEERKTESTVFVSPHCINGKVARILMPPNEPPLPQSAEFRGLRFTGRQCNYLPKGIQWGCDTWYPSWSDDDKLYSSCTDGTLYGSDGNTIEIWSGWSRGSGGYYMDLGGGPADASGTTGNVVLTGDDPFHLTITPLRPFRHPSPRYEGYYPCGNLVYRGAWYYGGYYCHRWLSKHSVPITYELGGFGGFRISTDQGQTWQDTPHNDERPLFPETGRCSGGAPIRMGAPHFVDFGRSLEYSPDGYAYLAGHGTYDTDGIANWCSGDAISLARVHPSIGSMNDPTAWEFYGGSGSDGVPIWTNEFARIQPIIRWPGGAGCINITYHSVLKRYFAFICGGWYDGDSGTYNLWVVEAKTLTGPWFTVSVLRGNFGGQGYFVCMPSKFNRGDSRNIILFYSSNWSLDRPGIPTVIESNGPSGAYSLCVAEFELL